MSTATDERCEVATRNVNIRHVTRPERTWWWWWCVCVCVCVFATKKIKLEGDDLLAYVFCLLVLPGEDIVASQKREI